MKQTFNLKNGEIIFEEDKISIHDDAKKQKRMLLLTSFLWAFYGIASVLRYFKSGDQFLLWTGLFIGIAHSILFILTFSRSSKSEIPLNIIKSFKVKNRFGNKFLDIRLNNNRIRRVNKIDHLKEIQQYLDTIRTSN